MNEFLKSIFKLRLQTPALRAFALASAITAVFLTLSIPAAQSVAATLNSDGPRIRPIGDWSEA